MSLSFGFVTVDDLREEGFTVYEARNAHAALLALEEHRDIGVMFTDVDMPGSMNGLTMSFVVREQHPDMKILITSGMHHLADCMMPKGGRFLPKPYLASTVTGAIMMSSPGSAHQATRGIICG